MSRPPRNAPIETREARRRLPEHHEPYWRQIHVGLSLGYYKGGRAGVWFLRLRKKARRYQKSRLGLADDQEKADGSRVLTFEQAQRLALELAENPEQRPAHRLSAAYSVADAVADYLEWFEAHRKSLYSTRVAFEKHILPSLGDRAVGELTTRELGRWHRALAKTESEDPERQRGRKATANRVLTMLRASLNRAWREGYADSNDAWRRVQPFRDVEAARVKYLNQDEARRLLNAADADFRPLVHAALLTGCRYGELTALQCGDYDPDAGTVQVRHSKAGKSRHVPLTDEGSRFFEDLTAGRAGAETMLRRRDREPWGTSHQKRRMREACARAGIEPVVSFHVMRHTYGSLLALQGVPLKVIAEAMGHADTRMTERHYAHLQDSYVAEQIRANLPTFGKASERKVTPIRGSRG